MLISENRTKNHNTDKQHNADETNVPNTVTIQVDETRNTSKA